MHGFMDKALHLWYSKRGSETAFTSRPIFSMFHYVWEIFYMYCRIVSFKGMVHPQMIFCPIFPISWAPILWIEVLVMYSNPSHYFWFSSASAVFLKLPVHMQLCRVGCTKSASARGYFSLKYGEMLPFWVYWVSSSGHLDISSMFFLCCLSMMESMATIDFQWVGFFVCKILQNSNVGYVMLP